jgi:glycosyltransferase involved in cell wall biosynthesis
MKITLIKGGVGDTYYELGLLSGLVTKDIIVDFIGSERDVLKHTDILKHKNVTFRDYRGELSSRAKLLHKVLGILRYYARLLLYALKTNSRIFHVQWMEKLVYFDRTFLMIYYKLLGKKVVFTAHNVNAGERDGHDSLMNRLTLKVMYQIVDHIIVHTQKMKDQLIREFRVSHDKVSVIPYGINNMIPISNLTSQEAREKLHISAKTKVLLFFGNIVAYKGLEYLLMALSELAERYEDLLLIIVGRVSNKENAAYWKTLEKIMEDEKLTKHVVCRTEFIPDEDIEIYFKAADVLILPYKHIFQSGVLYLSYAFGLPVIATDVGSLREDVIDEKTGYICRPADAKDLAQKIDRFFNSALYGRLEEKRIAILNHVHEEHSWEEIGAKTISIYYGLCAD